MATAPPPAVDKAGSQATTSLVLGILGLVCCQLLSPVAWYIGNQELRSIREGRSPAAGQGTASAGMILGVVGSVFLAMGVLMGIIWVFVFGGLAALAAFLDAAR
jgi:hypothetical protein